MPLTNLNSLVQFNIGVLGASFAPGFPVQNPSDFVVIDTNPTTLVDTVLTLNTDYFVTGTVTAGVYLSPMVTLEGLGTRYAVGDTLTIQRKNPLTNPTVYTDGTKFPAAADNNALDWILYSIQQLRDQVLRCLAVPATSPVQATIPIASRKSQLAGWDANGNFTTYTATGNGGIQPFPVALLPSFPIFLPLVTATTGGLTTNLDGVNIVGITQPLVVMLSIGDNTELWKFRAYQAGDLNASDGTTTVVPVTNPNNWRWIRIS